VQETNKSKRWYFVFNSDAVLSTALAEKSWLHWRKRTKILFGSRWQTPQCYLCNL